jgi:hypothetical protein
MTVCSFTPEIDFSRVESTLTYWVTTKLDPHILFGSMEFELLHSHDRLYFVVDNVIIGQWLTEN